MAEPAYTGAMRRSHQIVVLAGVVGFAIVAAVAFTAQYAQFANPEFQRAMLRFLAVIGLAAILAMCGSLLMRADDIDQLARQPVAPSRRTVRRR